MAARDTQGATIGYSGPIIEEVSEFSDDDSSIVEPKMMSTNGDLGGSLTDFGQKKSSLLSKMNATSASSSNCFSSSSSEKMLKSSSSTSVTSSKKAQIRHAVTSASSASCQEMKQQQQQQNEIFQQENRNFSRSVSVTSNASSSSDSRLKLLSCSSGFSVDDDSCLSQDQSLQESLKFEKQQQQQKVTSSSSKVKMNSSSTTAEGYTEEKVAAINQERKQVRSGSISYEESSTTAALQHKLEADGFTTEKVAALRQDQRQLKTPDSLQQQQRTAMAASMKLSTDEFTAEKVAMSKQEEMRSFSSQGIVQAEKNVTAASSSKVTFTSKNNIAKTAISSQNLHQVDIRDMSHQGLGMLSLTDSTMEPFASIQSKDSLVDITDGMEQDVELLKKCPSPGADVDKIIQRFGSRMATCIEKLKTASAEEAVSLLKIMSKILKNAWAVPCYGHDLGSTMCKILMDKGAVDILIANCVSSNSELQFRSAKVLELSLSTENRAYVVNNGLEQVVNVACLCSAKCLSSQSRVGTGILEHLFKHCETTCSSVIRMGGLKAILFNCRSSDVETLRHCATALANLSLYGGPENQQAMIKHKVPVWLFPLAFHDDDNIKYYACLAISSLVANKEIEAAVLKSGTLDLVEPFVTSHSPEEFAKSHVAHVHGQSKNWLQRLVNVLDSKREEARNLAAFHFAMEAGIKKKQGNTQVFHEVGAVEALKKVASSPNAIASKFAAQALYMIGEEVPHKLSQQVPLWTAEDVREWVKQIGFSGYCTEFASSRVDGDLLLQLTEDMLKDDIGIKNGILRRRFLRELNQLKKMADYTSCDSTYLNQILQNLGPEFSQYTYQMLHCGIQRDTLKYISEEQLVRDCGIENSIHRLRIAHAIQGMAQQSESAEEEDKNQKPLDVFVSYRRSNGSQLASLLKVHLQLRGFSVFIDVERLEAGKFDNNLLQSIRQAKHFILVLTPNALERCISDNEGKDWVHKEIIEALQSQCNIIPILDNFQWPEPETLPEDMRAISYFNGVRWIHDYQDACVDKLERFLRGEMNVRNDGPLGRFVSIAGAGAGTPSTPSTNTSIGTGVAPSGGKIPQPVYQRSTSSDSSKGTSDKDCCNGPTNGNGREASQTNFGNF